MSFSLVRSCAACGVGNRVPAKHLAEAGRCGSCKAPLPPLDEPLEADAASFDAIVSEAQVPVLVDFWAAWCAPCRMAAPEVHALAREIAGRALVLKVDTEAHPDVAERFGVRAIPNFVVIRNGSVASQRAGLASRAEMRRWLEQAGAA
jgi:thioredoxin 2